MGFYQPAIVLDAVVSRLAGSTVVIPSGSAGGAEGGVCPAGTSLEGGEVTSTGVKIAIGETFQSSIGEWWRAWVVNNDGFSQSFTVYSRCRDTPLTRASPS